MGVHANIYGRRRLQARSFVGADHRCSLIPGLIFEVNEREELLAAVFPRFQRGVECRQNICADGDGD